MGSFGSGCSVIYADLCQIYTQHFGRSVWHHQYLFGKSSQNRKCDCMKDHESVALHLGYVDTWDNGEKAYQIEDILPL